MYRTLKSPKAVIFVWTASTREAKNYEKLTFFTLFPAALPLNIFFSSKKKIDKVFICNRTPIHERRHQNKKIVGNEMPYCASLTNAWPWCWALTLEWSISLQNVTVKNRKANKAVPEHVISISNKREIGVTVASYKSKLMLNV